jgi:glutaconyl-CoA decarboxylase
MPHPATTGYAETGKVADNYQECTAVKKLRVTVNGVSYDVDVEVLEDDEAAAPASGLAPSPAAPPAAPRPAAPKPAAPAAAPAAPAAPATPAAGGGGGNELTAPLAGIVVEVKVAVGDSVNQGDPVIVVEAMKMNTNVASPTTGKVTSVNVKPGDNVKQSQVLMTFE